jgi:hypothetical protein
MKRTVSIVLLIVTLVSSVQATLVFHYCGGKFHSAGLLKNELPKSCCDGEHKNCCSNELLKIATDNYQLQQQDLTELAPLIQNPVLYLLFDNLFTSESDDSFALQNIFPPGGLAGYGGADILHRHCVYRI